jgi:hypothetical protein
VSYNINLSNGTTLATVSDGSIDTSHSSLTLIGRNYAGYGQFLNENFVYLLENFANTTSPANPLKGQLWWDTRNNILRVWSGTSWKISTGATSQSTPPTDLSALGGDLWFDTINQQLKVYTGTGFLVIGPVSTPATGTTGAFPAVMTDAGAGTHVVIQFQISGQVYAILSKDGFTSTLPGFINIVPGWNFNQGLAQSLGFNTQSISAVPSTLVLRDINSGINVGGITGTTITASTVNAGAISGTFTGSLVGNVTASTVTSTSITAQIVNATTGLTVAGTANLGSVYAGNYFFANGQPFVSSSYSNSDVAAYLTGTISTGPINTSGSINIAGDIIPTQANTYNIGSSTSWFNNIYGTAIHAKYADLAERFHADAEYAPGTVVEMGGTAEITKVVAELSDKVFGVISTNAAYLMNSSAGEDSTHPPVAMSGRVPVRVTGKISKGDRLVSAGNGLARAGKQSELTPFNVIGRSLVDKLDSDESIIEAIVKINS